MKLSKKPNYKAWEISPHNFPKSASVEKQIQFILGFGILAPSGHNGQPWKFKITGPVLEIYSEQTRALVQSDPLGKQLHISIGCLIENLAIAGNYFGFEVSVIYQNNTSKEGLLATLTFKQSYLIKPIDGNAHLLNFISKRATNRNKYKSKSLPEKFVNECKLLETADEKIFICQSPETNKFIAELAVEAQIFAMEKDYFRMELSELMKPNHTSSHIGMPGFVHGLPWPLSVVTPLIIKRFNLSKFNKKIDTELFKIYTPAYIIIAGSRINKTSWLNSGRIFERVWLIAEKFGLKCSPNAAPVQEDFFCEQLQTLLKTKLWPITLMRVGYCGKSSLHSPRLNVESVII